MEFIYLLLMLFSISSKGFARVDTLPEQNTTLPKRYFNDEEAEFGNDLPEAGIMGLMDIARPLNACLSVVPVPKQLRHYNMIALVEESDNQHFCGYDLQVMNCQTAGYNAVIVYANTFGDQLVEMTGDGPDIPSVYVTKKSGVLLKRYTYKTSTIQITPNPRIPLQLYLIPFAVVVGICFCFMVVFSLGRYCRYRIRQRKSKLSPKTLKKIPTKKYEKGDEFETCAICLDDYEEGEKIRILPCHHAYHCKCVDPWLTSGKKVCPICKQNVDPKKKKELIGDGSTSSRYHDDDEDDDVTQHSHDSHHSDDSHHTDDSYHTDENYTDDSDHSDETTPLLSHPQNRHSNVAMSV